MRLTPECCSVHTHSVLCDGKGTLAEMAAAQGIEPAGDEAAQSDGLLKLQIKALVAERLFPREGFYRVMNAADGSMFRRAVELLGAWSEQGKHILSKRK